MLESKHVQLYKWHSKKYISNTKKKTHFMIDAVLMEACNVAHYPISVHADMHA